MRQSRKIDPYAPAIDAMLTADVEAHASSATRPVGFSPDWLMTLFSWRVDIGGEHGVDRGFERIEFR